MRCKVAIPLAVLAALSLIVAAQAIDKRTGQIAGTVIDLKTKAPIVDASVLILGTSRGVKTDFDGKYLIRRVPPGEYTLRISHLDYQTIEHRQVRVSADSSVTIDIGMTQRVTDIDALISVTAEPEIKRMSETGNQTTIIKEPIGRQAPVQTVDELLNEVGGIVTNKKGKVFVRGGRHFEVSYITDGVPLGDPIGGLGQAGAKLSRVGKDGIIRYCPPSFPPAHGGTSIVNGEPFDAMFFKHYGVNPFVDTEDDRLSTFAIDVDNASFVMTRTYLESSTLPPADAVRTEEFINNFNYHYQGPSESAFSVCLDGGPSKFGVNSQLLRIGIKGKKISDKNRKAANLVFVIDVSGSMNRENRLELVKKALRLLVGQLRYDDRIGVVVYGSRGRVILDLGSDQSRQDVLYAIGQLQPGGSTNAEEGLLLGYEMAQRNFDRRKINRIILCSDGVANVGRTGPDEILRQIKKYADKGITLSSIGFGMGNYNDRLLEKLGNKGNGYYAYVNDIGDARRIFVDNLTGSLQVIARDVKIQVDFDPRVVRSYRLLGYENRDVEDAKFRDDTEDGGEIGSGHSVTALYEIKLCDESETDNLGAVHIRFKDPDTDRVEEVVHTIGADVFRDRFASCSPEFRLAAAAAEFAEIMRESYWAKGSKLGNVLNVVSGVYYDTNDENALELMNLVSTADRLRGQLADQ